MAWYAAGTVTATNNSGTITGTGTSFIGNVRVGDGIVINGSSSMHEVTGVTSNTQMTIAPVFTGTTGSGKTYRVAPMLGYDKDLSDAFNQIRLNWGSQLSQLKPWAYAPTVDQSLDELGFSAFGKDFVKTASAATGRTLLELGTASIKNTGTVVGDIIVVGNNSSGGLLARPPSITSWADGVNGGTRFQRNDNNTVDGFGINAGVLTINTANNYSGMIGVSHTSLRAFIGHVNNGASAVWSELYHKNNILGTVSQVGGVPSGAIIEMGSNANGEYVKFANGTMICTANVTFNLNGTSNNQTYTYPATFSQRPVGFFTPPTSLNATTVLNSSSVVLQTMIGNWRLVQHGSGTSNDSAFIIGAIGRWY